MAHAIRAGLFQSESLSKAICVVQHSWYGRNLVHEIVPYDTPLVCTKLRPDHDCCTMQLVFERLSRPTRMAWAMFHCPRRPDACILCFLHGSGEALSKQIPDFEVAGGQKLLLGRRKGSSSPRLRRRWTYAPSADPCPYDGKAKHAYTTPLMREVQLHIRRTTKLGSAGAMTTIGDVRRSAAIWLDSTLCRTAPQTHNDKQTSEKKATNERKSTFGLPSNIQWNTQLCTLAHTYDHHRVDINNQTPSPTQNL